MARESTSPNAQSTSALEKRLRRVAIVYSSIESDAAQQLILQLPPKHAKKVRLYAQQLEDVTAQERASVLREFEELATQNSGSVHNNTTAEPEYSSCNAWNNLTDDAISRAIKGERPLVIAVVASQLPPDKAVSVLGRLGKSISCKVVEQLTSLSEMDLELKTEIDRYLAVKLGEHQSQMESEHENRRRIQSLISSAPSDLQSAWALAASSKARSPFSTPMPPPIASHSEPSTPPSALGPVDGFPLMTVAHALPQNVIDASPASPDAHSEFDRSIVQLEFEDLLTLPQQILSKLIAESENETLLLAIAGATPAFASELRVMLGQETFDELDQRVKQLGAIRISDIDQAQSRLVEHAQRLTNQSLLAGQPETNNRRIAS